MKIIAINGTYRSNMTTSQLANKALEGAASQGAQTEMILLKDLDIKFCHNCLKCYKDLESEISPCSIKDDMDMILEKLKECNGVILASPVHNGFITGLMTLFFERLVWRFCKPTGKAMGLKGLPENRMPNRLRAIATIVSAGGIPPRLRRLCDAGTPFMRENGQLYLNGDSVGSIYAGAYLKKIPETDAEWANIYFLRELTDKQLTEAYDLGVKMVKKIKDNKIKPYDLKREMGPFMNFAGKWIGKFYKFYQKK